MKSVKKLIAIICGVNLCLLLATVLFPEDTKLPSLRKERHKCRDHLCSEYLLFHDDMSFRQCLNKQEKSKLPQVAKAPQGDCKFQNGTSKDPVALVSFPGSGNTWLRGLLEQATDICTGSVYCDVNLRSAGFNGEGVQSSSVIAVKTHSYEPLWLNKTAKAANIENPGYGSAVILIRNPFHALVAEWNRYMAKELLQSKNAHTKVVGKEHFGDNKEWEGFIRHKIIVWQYIIYIWVVKNTGHGHPTLLVKYEDIQTDRVAVVKEILGFLQVPYNAADLERRLASNYTKFLRSRDRTVTNFEHFTAAQKKHIATFLAETNAMLVELHRSVLDYIP